MPSGYLSGRSGEKRRENGHWLSLTPPTIHTAGVQTGVWSGQGRAPAMTSVERTIAALYIDPRGPYPKMANVDCWDESRDARLYAGPHPVVAHPPCGPWGNLRHMRQLRRELDARCGPRAVEQVRAYGGVLEQPAGSKLWAYCGLPAPGVITTGGEFTIHVEQVAWGHVARKPTWVYCVGVPVWLADRSIRTGGTPTHWCSGGRKRSKGSGGLVPPGIKVCSAQQRRRTPPEFAEWLVSLARSARAVEAA